MYVHNIQNISGDVHKIQNIIVDVKGQKLKRSFCFYLVNPALFMSKAKSLFIRWIERNQVQPKNPKNSKCRLLPSSQVPVSVIFFFFLSTSTMCSASLSSSSLCHQSHLKPPLSFSNNGGLSVPQP